MARLPRDLPIVTSDHSVTLPFLFELDDDGRFDQTLEFARWTHPTITERATGRLSRSQACLAQLIVLDLLAIPNSNDHWAILALTDSMPVVDTRQLTEPCVKALLFHTAKLHEQVFGRLIRGPRQLANAVLARKATTSTVCKGVTADYTTWLDVVEETLLPHIRR